MTKQENETKCKRGSEGYIAVAKDNQSITMNTNEILGDKMTQLFFTEVHLLAGKLDLVVAIHSLGGSHAEPSIGCRTTNTR